MSFTDSHEGQVTSVEKARDVCENNNAACHPGLSVPLPAHGGDSVRLRAQAAGENLREQVFKNRVPGRAELSC